MRGLDGVQTAAPPRAGTASAEDRDAGREKSAAPGVLLGKARFETPTGPARTFNRRAQAPTRKMADDLDSGAHLGVLPGPRTQADPDGRVGARHRHGQPAARHARPRERTRPDHRRDPAARRHPRRSARRRARATPPRRRSAPRTPPPSAPPADTVRQPCCLWGAIWNDVDDRDETPGCVAARLGCRATVRPLRRRRRARRDAVWPVWRVRGARLGRRGGGREDEAEGDHVEIDVAADAHVNGAPRGRRRGPRPRADGPRRRGRSPTRGRPRARRAARPARRRTATTTCGRP